MGVENINGRPGLCVVVGQCVGAGLAYSLYIYIYIYIGCTPTLSVR